LTRSLGQTWLALRAMAFLPGGKAMRWICVVLLASCLMTGCAEYELHGKVGVGCGAVVAVPTGLVVGVLALPITVPFALGAPGEYTPTGVILFPFLVGGACGYYAGYYAGATCAYPLHLLVGEPLHKLRLAPMSDLGMVEYLVESMPYVSEADYGRLVRASRRTYAPPYSVETYPGRRFGQKPEVEDDLVSEWRAWLEGRRRAGAPDEASFVLRYNTDLLTRGSYHMRSRAIEALSELRHPGAIEPLILSAMGDESIREEAAGALQKLPGKQFGEDQGAWQKWWQENKESFLKERQGGSEQGPASPVSP